jgi:hypothetical protein
LFDDGEQIELVRDGDGDVFIQESESRRSTICPVTQMEMEDPMRKYVNPLIAGSMRCSLLRVCLRRSPSCGHTYSKKGIQALLQRNKKKCPVAGMCGLKYCIWCLLGADNWCAGCPQKLSLSSLERDVEMEVIIARRYRIYVAFQPG